MMEIESAPISGAEEKLQDLGELNPKFKEASYEIHLPNLTLNQCETDAKHLASFFHEYFHLVQATTTTHGIARFILLADRIIAFCTAVRGRKTIFRPVTKWAQSDSHDPELTKYLSYLKHYAEQVEIIEGRTPPRTVSGPEFAVVHLDIPFKTGTVKRYNIVRKIGSDFVAIPLYGDVIAEAQAELVSCYMTGSESLLLSRAGIETNAKSCVYTTIPVAVHLALPKWPLAETVFLLTNFAMMTSAPDHSLLSAIQWIKTNRAGSPPTRREEWNALHWELETVIPIFRKSLQFLKEDISKKQEFYGKFSDHYVMKLFSDRLTMSEGALARREVDPMCFFPWEATREYVHKNFLQVVPATFVKFSDGIQGFGSKATPKQIQDQATLTGIEYLRKVLEGEARNSADLTCPYLNDLETCTAKREYACRVAPWARGDIGGELRCPLWAIGTMLGIEGADITDI